MNKITLLFLAALLFASCSREHKFNGTFSYYPLKPKAGENITIMFLPDSTKLSDADSIKLVAYLYGKDLNETRAIEMNRKDKGWTADLATNDSTRGVIIKFKNEDLIDNNDKNGYIIYLYGDNDKILPGSVAGLGAAIYSWGSYYIDMERDIDTALNKMQSDFKNYPEIKKDYLDSYLSIITRKYPSTKDSIIKSELVKLEKDGVQSEDEAELLATWYSNIDDTAKINSYKKLIEDKYPNNSFVQEDLYRKIYNEKNIDKKIALLKEFENKYPDSKILSAVYDVTINSLRDKKQYKEIKNLLEENTNKPSAYRFYSVVARMLDENADMQTALDIAKMGVERSRKEVDNPTDEKPRSLTGAEWNDEREYILGLNLYGYGNVLYKLKKLDEALPALKEAVNLTKSQEGDLNELYTTALVDAGNYETAMTTVETFIKEGKSTQIMNELLKQAYVKKNGSDKGFNEYASKFENFAKENLIAKLKTELIKEPAPKFSLTDLKGEKISLSDMKGKTIVLDFWATWCGPCLSSFPGMKKTVEKYSNDDKVQFLFVNSWERVDNKLENTMNFIAKNNYPFHVLMDTENEVISKFKVSGIPTKFIIDKNGNIRFMKIGFDGNTDQIVEEISAMISLVN